MKNMKKQHSVVPVYLVALLWAVGGFGFRIHTVLQILLFVALSVGILLVGALVSKLRSRSATEEEYYEEDVDEADDAYEEDESAEDPEEDLYRPEDPEVAALRQERDRAVLEMRRLNHHIGDAMISRQINRVEFVTDKMFECVTREPGKKTEVRRFLNYYLPTTIKLLGTYDRLGDNRPTTNVDGAKKKIGDLMTTIVRAFDHQLDALYRGETLDINAEIQVLYQVLNKDGRSGGTRK